MRRCSESEEGNAQPPPPPPLEFDYFVDERMRILTHYYKIHYTCEGCLVRTCDVCIYVLIIYYISPSAPNHGYACIMDLIKF
jgi:hypothetical protein